MQVYCLRIAVVMGVAKVLPSLVQSKQQSYVITFRNTQVINYGKMIWNKAYKVYLK